MNTTYYHRTMQWKWLGMEYFTILLKGLHETIRDRGWREEYWTIIEHINNSITDGLNVQPFPGYNHNCPDHWHPRGPDWVWTAEDNYRADAISDLAFCCYTQIRELRRDFETKNVSGAMTYEPDTR